MSKRENVTAIQNEKSTLRKVLRDENTPVRKPYQTSVDPESPGPDVSIVIPVYNEEGLIATSVVDLVDQMQRFDFDYEIVLAENGSSDNTLELARELEARYPQVRAMHNENPDYGMALRKGILSSRAEFVLCDEIDICDSDFYVSALSILFPKEADMVVGSKCLSASKDQRPVFRRLSTFVINFLLRIFLGFKGTDTHGLKAFNRAKLLHTVNECMVNKDLFASEFVIRTERSKFSVVEVPVEIIEKRAPSINLMRRVPHVLKNLAKLVWLIRIK